MDLYLDDNCVKASLASMLRRAGHQVTLPTDLGLVSAMDPRHLASCAGHGRALITKDHDDFLDLHDLVQATRGRHADILVVRSDNDPGRDMTDREIVRALANLEGAGMAIENEYHILNHWR
jgi:predicted nuclease of predicted toxin-antitoxin system